MSRPAGIEPSVRRWGDHDLTVTNSLTRAVAASPDEVRGALHQLDLAAPALQALHAIGLSVTLRRGALTWRPDGVRGHVDVDVHVRVEPAAEDSSYLSITTRFTATEAEARARLLDAWPVIGPLAEHLAQRAARTVKHYAEEDRFDEHHAIRVGKRAASGKLHRPGRGRPHEPRGAGSQPHGHTMQP